MVFFKGLIHFQNKQIPTIHSPPHHPKCSCPPLLSRKEIKVFEKNVPGLFSTQWTPTVANGPKVHSKVRFQCSPKGLHTIPAEEQGSHPTKRSITFPKTKMYILFNLKCSFCTSSVMRTHFMH